MCVLFSVGNPGRDVGYPLLHVSEELLVPICDHMAHLHARHRRHHVESNAKAHQGFDSKVGNPFKYIHMLSVYCVTIVTLSDMCTNGSS